MRQYNKQTQWSQMDKLNIDTLQERNTVITKDRSRYISIIKERQDKVDELFI